MGETIQEVFIKLNWFDYCVVLIFTLFIVISFFRGVTKEFLSLFSWILSFPIAYRISPLLEPCLGRYINDERFLNMTSLFICFLFTLIVMLVTTSVVSECVKNSKLAGINNFLGTIVGFLKAMLLFCVFYSCLFIFDVNKKKLNFARDAHFSRFIYLTLRNSVNYLYENDFDEYVFRLFNYDINLDALRKLIDENNLSRADLEKYTLKKKKTFGAVFKCEHDKDEKKIVVKKEVEETEKQEKMNNNHIINSVVGEGIEVEREPL